VANAPKICAARAVSPPRKSTTSLGRTGMIMPSASMSSSTVMKTKTKAGERCAGAAAAVSSGLISCITQAHPQVAALPARLRWLGQW
jgi:hypothetical protein